MALASPPSTPPSGIQSAATDVSPPSTKFDIVSHYNELVARDSSLAPPIAAIESLIALLSSNPLTTISETLALLSHQSSILLASQTNPIPLSAGTELFQRYLVSSFQQRPSAFVGGSDFNSLRTQLISNSRIFVHRAKQARVKIAHHALPFIKEDSTTVTYGDSRVVHAILNHGMESKRYFNVINVTSPSSISPSIQNLLSVPLSRSTSSTLPIPIATIPFHTLTYALASLSQTTTPQIIVGAHAVLENGSTISRLGTHQLALIAKALRIPFYVAVESYKFVRSFPVGYGKADLERLGVKQDVLKFTVVSYGSNGSRRNSNENSPATATTTTTMTTAAKEKQQQAATAAAIISEADMVDITPPELISALITENGIMTPNAVSEELIKLWF